jgi:hypothetical protein
MGREGMHWVIACMYILQQTYSQTAVFSFRARCGLGASQNGTHEVYGICYYSQLVRTHAAPAVQYVPFPELVANIDYPSAALVHWNQEQRGRWHVPTRPQGNALAICVLNARPNYQPLAMFVKAEQETAIAQLSARHA